jgi:hypothetical protein
MPDWRLRSRSARLAVAGALAGACMLVAVAPALAADAPLPPPNSDDWGTIVPNVSGPQADAWIARLKGLNGVVNTTLFESHDPPIPGAPRNAGGGKGLITLPGIGVGSALATRALADMLPAGSQGAPDVPAPGAAYAMFTGAMIDVGMPYIPNPIPGYNQPNLSPWGLHLDGITGEVWSKPGKPLAVRGSFGTGYLSSFGVKVIDIPLDWPENTVVRIPPDRTQPPIGLFGFKEIVTTNGKGQPTVDPQGHYIYSPIAASGYLNAGHASFLGTNVADLTVGHAATLIGTPPVVPAAAGGSR